MIRGIRDQKVRFRAVTSFSSMGRGPKSFSLLAIDCTTGEGVLWRVGKFKPPFLQKENTSSFPSLKRSHSETHFKKPFNFLKNY